MRGRRIRHCPVQISVAPRAGARGIPAAAPRICYCYCCCWQTRQWRTIRRRSLRREVSRRRRRRITYKRREPLAAERQSAGTAGRHEQNAREHELRRTSIPSLRRCRVILLLSRCCAIRMNMRPARAAPQTIWWRARERIRRQRGTHTARRAPPPAGIAIAPGAEVAVLRQAP